MMLRHSIIDFAERGLVEERHMLDGRVDYVLEKKGEQRLKEERFGDLLEEQHHSCTT